MNESIKTHISLIYLLLATMTNVISQDTVKTTYPDSNLIWEKIYNEQSLSEESIYHANGNEWMTVDYASPTDQYWEWFYDDGKPYFKARILNDMLDGKYQIWYPNGQLAEEIIFDKNVENGPAYFYYKNGQLAMQGFYSNGKMTGEWMFYMPNGELANGQWTWYFAASPEVVRMKGFLKHGIRRGEWEYKSTANQNRPSQLTFKTTFPNQ